jgi:hypothetical protein
MELNKCLRIDDYKEQTTEMRKKIEAELDQIQHDLRIHDKVSKQ